MTNEQREARQHLEALGRYRIESGSDGWPRIVGHYGAVEWDCGDTVFTGHQRMIPKLLAVPGVSRYQTGDTEANMLLRPDAIGPVLNLIQARRRRPPMTTEQARNLGAGTAYRAASGDQEARSDVAGVTAT